MVSISSYDERPQSPFQRLANLREHKELRMKSFRRIPNYLSTLIEQFTENGFYYMGDGKNDKVQCAFCGIVISGWDATDDVTRQHLLLYPSCVHARSKCQVAAPEETKYCSDVKYIAYKGEEARHRSFKSWSCSSEDFPTVEALVQAGLFYTGDDDACLCYVCGNELSDWEPGDCPKTEHDRNFPECPLSSKAQ